MKETTRAFGAWLANEIDNRDWRQADLVEALGVKPGVVSAWINGLRRPSYENCLAIASAIGLDAQDVLARAGRQTTSAGDPELAAYAEIGRKVVAALGADRRFRALLSDALTGEADAPGAVPFAVLAAEFDAWRRGMPEAAAELERDLAATPPEDRAAVFARVMGMRLSARALAGELADPAAPTDDPAGRSSRRAPPE